MLGVAFSYSMEESIENVRYGRRVTWAGFWCNAGLSALKVWAGVVGRSSAMVADGIHSASDLLTDMVVLVVIGASRRKADHEHTYGHGKIETFATFLIAMLLIAVGLGIGAEGVGRIVQSLRGVELESPGWVALAMAFVSIAVKEWLFRYTRRAGERIGSSAMVANAWHHRSDALSSLATLAGIGGAMFLGVQWRVLDPLAAVVVSVLIIMMGVKMCRGAVGELMERSLPEAETDHLVDIISSTEGVLSFHHLRTRRNGSTRIIDVHVKMDGDITLHHAHDIATEVETRLKEAYDDTIINIHMEPL